MPDTGLDVVTGAFSYSGHEIASALISAGRRVRSRIQFVPGWMVPATARLLGLALRDVLLTGDEYRAMAAGLADTDGPATGTTRLSAWLADNAPGLGRDYANELNRHFRKTEGAR